MTTKHNDALGTYRSILKGWVKALGSKPTAEMFEAVHALGCRPGKQALARAMELREEGATDGQVKQACIIGWGNSGSHHNKRKDLITAKWVKREAMPPAGNHTVYKIVMTEKGLEKVAGVLVPVKKPTKKRVKKVVPVMPVQDVPVTQEVQA